ncbi:MAG: hypothetical protein JWP74_1885 [Marmoricola sp.]|nr:hypothetical protein [Marmoricola sp.]
MTTSIQARLQRLEDTEAARELLQVYAERVDNQDPALIAALFAAGATFTTQRGMVAGQAAIRDHFAATFEADPSEKRHFAMSPRILGIEGRLVALRSTFLFVGRGATSNIGWGTYDDVVDTTGTSPLFTAKVIKVHMRGDLESGWTAASM